MKQNNLMSSRIQSTKEKENGNDPHTGIVSVLYYIRRSLFLPGFGDDLPKGGGKLFGRHGSCYLAQQVALGIEYEVGRDRPYAVFACQGFPGRFVDVVLGRDEIFVHKITHLLFREDVALHRLAGAAPGDV